MGIMGDIAWHTVECDYCTRTIIVNEGTSFADVCADAIKSGWTLSGDCKPDGSPQRVVCGEGACMRKFAEFIIEQTPGPWGKSRD